MRDLFGFRLLDQAAATATATANHQGLSSVAPKVGTPVGGEGASSLSPVSAKVEVAPGGGEGIPGSSAVSAKAGPVTGGGEGASGAPASPTLCSMLR